MRTRRLYAKIWMLLGILLLVIQGGLPAAVQAATITYGATTVAGTTGSSGFSGDEGAATAAKLNTPNAVAVDGSGNIYIADTENHRIRKVGTDGKISTVAGTGTQGYNGDNRAATAANLDTPTAVAVDGSGNLYIADSFNNRIRKVDTAGKISTFAGTGSAGSGTDGTAATAFSLSYPCGLALDDSDNLYIADTSNHRVLKVNAAGIVSTVAGTGSYGFSGDGGAATAAKMDSPVALAVGPGNVLYIVDNGIQNVRKVGADGKISTFVGGNGDTSEGAPASSSPLFLPSGISTDSSGNVYVSNTLMNQVRKVDIISGKIYTIQSTALNNPHGLAVDNSGSVFVADTYNHQIRKLTILSDDAGLTSLAGLNDGSPAGGDGTSAGAAITWSVNVPNSKNAVGRADIVAAAGATSKFYSDSGFASEVTGSATLPLAAGAATTAYVKVTASDGVTVKYYAVTVNRGPALSGDAGLTTIAGQADSSPAGGDGSAAGAAVVWTVSVPNSKAAVGLTDIAPATGATSKLYADSGFTMEITGSATISLTAGAATTVYVKVTAQDGVTSKYYAVTFHRAAALNTDAGLTSVAGLTDSAPAGGEGASADTAVTWSVNVPNGKADLGLSDIVTAADATYKLYSDSSFATEVTGSSTIALTAGAATTVYVKVTAQDSVTAKYYAVTVHRDAALSDDAGLTSVAGRTDSAPAGGDGASAGTAVTWSVNVPNGKADVGRSDIVTVTGATYKLYSDSSFGTEVTGSSMIMLTAGATTTVYVKVTAQDSVTAKYYAVTIHRDAALSDDAGLTSVAGQTDSSPAGGDGTSAGTAVTWSVNVPNGKSAIGTADIATVTGATYSLYSDSDFATAIADSSTIALTAGTSTTVYIKVTAQDDVTVKYYAVTIRRAADEPTVQQPPASSQNNDVVVYVNGKAETTGTSTTAVVNGRTVTTISLDPQKIAAKLAAEGKGAIITVVTGGSSDISIARLNGESLQAINEYGATLELKTAHASYKIPASQLVPDALTAGLDSAAALQDIELQIEIAASASDKRQLAETAANAGGFAVVGSPVDFTVNRIYKGQSAEIAPFSVYVERTIELPDGTDPQKVTTAIVVEPDGTTRHVPTQVVVMDGKYYAKINSLTNSTYALVYHPLTFADVERHWAKEAVNDLGARMVVSGYPDGRFNPDASVTRAEFAEIVVRGLGLKPSEQAAAFPDVRATDWSGQAIQTAYAYGLIDGYEDGTFHPTDSITREQAVAILARAMQVTGLQKAQSSEAAAPQLTSFTDAALISPWARNSIAAALQTGIMTGRSSAQLAPGADITRAEAAALVARLLHKSGLI
ncbi:S-layer homology domain-containing protein [Cohnella sp. GbtcB17]|uniref:S-layer homology domain-containing protein n=1 Tax=Cohnella sp. GbtcB17 TaxID=2824762 RepID=UPI001C2FE5A1|nr:S-layer homology domain-containing protein [Cohnella sp. GbtcB17]